MGLQEDLEVLENMSFDEPSFKVDRMYLLRVLKDIIYVSEDPNRTGDVESKIVDIAKNAIKNVEDQWRD